MVAQTPLILLLFALVDELALTPSSARRGRPCQYSERLFLKALVLMVVRHLPTVHALVAVLDQPEMAAVRGALSEHGQLPPRRTFERRLKALPPRLPAQIALLGDHLLAQFDPWATGGHAAAIDSTVLPARRGLAQAAPRGGRCAAYQHRHRSALDEIGLARLGLWVEAASGRHRGRGLAAFGRHAHARQPR